MSTQVDEYLDTKEVARVVDLKVETIRYYHKFGLMPKADHFFGRSPVWKQSTIDAWIEERNEH